MNENAPMGDAAMTSRADQPRITGSDIKDLSRPANISYNRSAVSGQMRQTQRDNRDYRRR